jgi:hypothetical protein
LIAIDNYHFFFVHHDLAARVAVYFYLHKSVLNFLLAATLSTPTWQTTSTPTVYGKFSLLLNRALARMAHDGPCLRTSGIGNINACLRPRHAPESGKLGTVGHLP